MEFLQLILALFTFSLAFAVPIPDSEAEGLLYTRESDDSASMFVKRLEDDPTGTLFRRVDFDETEELFARSGLQRKSAGNNLRTQYKEDGQKYCWSEYSSKPGSSSGSQQRKGTLSKMVTAVKNKVKGWFGLVWWSLNVC